jgi:hypothetical protein
MAIKTWHNFCWIQSDTVQALTFGEFTVCQVVVVVTVGY